MILPAKSKPFLSPLVAVAFLIISVTGMMLLFHVKNGPVMVLHEWFGVVFVVAGALHVLLNVRPLLGYLRQRIAYVSLGVAFVLALAMILAGLQHRGPHHHHGAEPETVIDEG